MSQRIYGFTYLALGTQAFLYIVFHFYSLLFSFLFAECHRLVFQLYIHTHLHTYMLGLKLVRATRNKLRGLFK